MTATIRRLRILSCLVLCVSALCCYRQSEGENPEDSDTKISAVQDTSTDFDAKADTDDDTDAGFEAETSTNTNEDPGMTQKDLCEKTHGHWDSYSCGPYHCGVHPSCDALIPGCNCGMGLVFDDNDGCITSEDCPTCPDPEDPGVDYVHYSYQNPSVCDAADFQCDDDKYIPFECGCGCIKSETRLQCERSGGEWVYMSCGNWHCGEMSTCSEYVPGCNCGATKNVDPVTLQCVFSDECSQRR